MASVILPVAADIVDDAIGCKAKIRRDLRYGVYTVSYTHLRAHETVLDLVCRLLLEKKTKNTVTTSDYDQ